MNRWAARMMGGLVVVVLCGPGFAQIGAYRTAPKVTTGIEHASGSITLSYAAVSYRAGSTFTAMSEGRYPDRFMEQHRRQMRQMATLEVSGSEITVGTGTLAPGKYTGGFDVSDKGEWSMVFYSGDTPAAACPIEMKKGPEGGAGAPFLVLGLSPSTNPGKVVLAIHYGPSNTMVEIGTGS